jgi:hypothetical protein
MKKAIFISVWDGGYEIESSCLFNPKTREVTDIGCDDNGNDVDQLDGEFVRVDGVESDLVALNLDNFKSLWIEQEIDVDFPDYLKLTMEIKGCYDFADLFKILEKWDNKPFQQRLNEFLVRNNACYFQD